MLTASNFGPVCRMRQTTSCAAIVKAILYPSFIDNEAVKYGRENEEVARKELAIKLNKEIKPCGLFIDTENPCLGASPDGIIDENGLVEIKCPLSAEHLTAEKAVETVPSLKEILDSRHNRHMPIKNPRYIIEAKEEAAKKVTISRIKRQNIIESENGIEESKRFKPNVSMEAKMTDIALNKEQDDDCII
ncbi:hypothetical protein RF55_12640, partial [Lasius niger]